jgi:type I restriction enzyme S subunit
MVIKKGYKKTEVGVIPDDWEIDKITNNALITTGSRNTQDKIEGGSFPFFVRSSTVERINTYSFDGEAVLTAGDGVGTGKVFHYINGKFDFHQRVYKISDFKENLSGYFFHLYFSNHFLVRIMSMTAKSSVDSVRMKMIADMEIPLPPLKEQQAITTALSDVEALMTSLDKLIAKKRNLKQGTMQQLLTGKKRLPGFGGEWEVKKLGEISTLIGDGIHSTPQYVNYSEFYFINGNNLTDNSIKITEKCVSENEYCKHKKELNERTLLLSINGTIGNIAIFNDEKIILGKSVAFINLNKSLSINYIFYSLQAHSVKCYFEDELTGTTIRNLSLKSIRNTPLPIPSFLKEQQAIAQILSDMDAEIETLEKKRDKYQAIKQGMMQELLTGKTRLI